MIAECPTPFKLRFVSRREARLAALDIAERRKARRGHKRVVRRGPSIYECGCGGYHLTSGRKVAVRPVEVPEIDPADWIAG